MRILLIPLLLSFILTNCPTEEDTDLVEMQASVNPEEAGQVNPPEGTYVVGREIAISTKPADEQWQFIGWSGDTTAQGDTLTFEITSDMQLVANYEIPTDPQYMLLASAQPQEAGTVDPDSGQYNLGKSVDVEALPNDGWEFTSWDGDTTVAENPITVEMDKDYELIANFQELPPGTFSLTTRIEPTESGTVEPSEGTFEEGTVVEIEALSNDGWEFTDWSGDTTASQNPLSIEMNKDYNLVANFQELPPETFTLSTGAQPTEGGTVDPAEGTYEDGTELSVQALPNDGWRFVEWSGDTTVTGNPLAIVMDKNYSLTANFEQLPVLTTNVNPTEAGSVEPQSGTFEYNSTVDVEAIPAEGWEFVEWSGDVNATSNPLSITMDQDYSLTANFNELPQSFSNQITVSDGTNSKSLIFGMDAAATQGFDQGIDEELPYVTPPDGAYYRRFVIPDYALRADYRAIQEQETVWEMEFAPDEGQAITLSWDFSNSNHVGTLELTDDPTNPTFQVDMKSSTSYEVTDHSVGTLYIISNRGN